MSGSAASRNVMPQANGQLRNELAIMPDIW